MNNSMKVHIALLRGINVGGNNIIKMAELKALFDQIGLVGAKTYIQSGNVLFKSNEEEDQLIQKIQKGIEDAFGFKISVIVRTAEALDQILANCPFSEEQIAVAKKASAGESLYVSLLSEAPKPEKATQLDVYADSNNQFCISGRDIYLLFSDGISQSKLANKLQLIDLPMTVRNWNTLGKLSELAHKME